MLDPLLRIIVINQQCLDIYGLPGDIIKIGATAYDIVEQSVLVGNYPGLTVAAAWERASARLAVQHPWRVTQRLGNGRIVAIFYAPMPAGGWITTHLDITDRQNAEDRLAYLAGHDVLTGLANRKTLMDKLAALAGEQDYAILCLDLDGFKSVNDTLGHAAGDDLLRQVAIRLRACVRDDDMVARLGGDEFAIIQAGVSEAAPAAALAGRILASLGAPYDVNHHTIQSGTSIGISLAGDTAETGSLLADADAALYRAKADGRGIYRFFDADMAAPLRRRREMEIDLREALGLDQLELHYQPITDIDSFHVLGFEAQICWRHPQRGMILAAELLPLAQQTGLMGRIGAWLLQQACRDAQAWPSRIKLSVDLAPAQLRSPTLMEDLRAALAGSGLAPSRLEMEVPEAPLLQSTASSISVLNALRGLGVSIALDHFGSGASSLGLLRRFRFDRIKIDRSLVADLTAHQDSRAILRALTAIGRSLRLEVAAEGVESSAQLEVLRDLGCRSVQGSVSGQPVPACDLRDLLQPGMASAETGRGTLR